MRKPINKQEKVPPIIIKKAAGLFIADKGAPFKIIPTKMDIKPNTRPMTVANSKINPPILCFLPLHHKAKFWYYIINFIIQNFPVKNKHFLIFLC